MSVIKKTLGCRRKKDLVKFNEVMSEDFVW
jgi:hypothetical protein